MKQALTFTRFAAAQFHHHHKEYRHKHHGQCGDDHAATCAARGPLTRWLARLGNRSLGALLFSHAGFVRGPLVSRRLDVRDALYSRAVVAMNLNSTAKPAVLWARRSNFSFGRQRVLVTEVFSPSLAT